MCSATPAASFRNFTCASWEIFSGETRMAEKARRSSAMSAGLAVTHAMPELGKVTLAVEANS